MQREWSWGCQSQVSCLYISGPDIKRSSIWILVLYCAWCLVLVMLNCWGKEGLVGGLAGWYLEHLNLKVVLRSCISENYISIILIWCLPQNYLIESHRVAARTRKAAPMLTTSARETSARRSSGRWRSTWAACTSSRRGARAPTPRGTSSTSATSRTRSRAWTALWRMSSRAASEMTRGACARIWSSVVTTQQ